MNIATNTSHVQLLRTAHRERLQAINLRQESEESARTEILVESVRSAQAVQHVVPVASVVLVVPFVSFALVAPIGHPISAFSTRLVSAANNQSWADISDLDDDEARAEYLRNEMRDRYNVDNVDDEDDELAIALQRSRRDVDEEQRRSSAVAVVSSDTAAAASSVSSEDLDLCAICYDDLKGLDKNIVALTCGHRFHFTCIFEQIKFMGRSQHRCGICRTGFGE